MSHRVVQWETGHVGSYALGAVRFEVRGVVGDRERMITVRGLYRPEAG